MIKALLDLFTQSQQDVKPAHRVELATAALMTEVIRADHVLLENELAAFQQLLLERFSLSDVELSALMDESMSSAKEATDLVQFTQVINKQCSESEKAEIVRHLWELAYADSEIVPLEEHIIRRIADLLYLSHSQFIKAKLDVIGH